MCRGYVPSVENDWSVDSEGQSNGVGTTKMKATVR
jgi:hypothetical protein